MTVRFYSSVASEKTLVGTITSGQTTLVVSNTVGLPGLFPYTISLDYETATEELVEVSSAAGTTLTVVRGIDGTSATSHTAGARVRHVSSARDFSDSRNHENADDGIHGLLPGEEIVGTDKVQTLTNKTVVNLQGTLLQPDINQVPPNHTTITNTPAFGGSITALDMINGVESVLEIKGNGNIVVRNPVSADVATATRRFVVMMSDGTTERFHIDTGGQATALPRAGTSDVNGGFKIVEPGDSVTRKAYQLRDSTDTIDRFTVFAGGHVDINSSDPSSVPLDVKAAPAQAASFMRVLDDANLVQVQVDNTGQLEARKTAHIISDTAPASVVLAVQGNATQTADLQDWNNGAGATLARVRSDGTADFSTSSASGVTVFSPAAGWSTTAAIAEIKAGMVTIVLTVQRTGAPLTASAGGDLAGDPSYGNIAAAYRPNGVLFGSNGMPFMATDAGGCGSMVLNPTNGDLNLWAWSSNGTIATGSLVRTCLTYPLVFA